MEEAMVSELRAAALDRAARAAFIPDGEIVPETRELLSDLLGTEVSEDTGEMVTVQVRGKPLTPQEKEQVQQEALNDMIEWG